MANRLRRVHNIDLTDNIVQHTHKEVIDNINYREVGHIPLSAEGVPNGVSTLDLSGTVPLSQLPEEVTSNEQLVNIANLKFEFNIAKLSAFKEFGYVNDVISFINIWEDNSKSLKLFSKSFLYINDKLSSITIINEISSDILTKTFAYNGEQLLSITEELI